MIKLIGLYKYDKFEVDIMRKRDLTFASAVLEAISAILAVAYIGLQIYYGVYYHIEVFKFIANILVLVLVYIGITWVQHYPEKLNHIPPELCTGNIRTYSLRMLMFVKLVFTAGLLVPCVCDAAGMGIRDVYSLIMIGLILVVSVYYEYRIIQEIRSMRK